MKAVTHLEKVITGEVSAVTHLEMVITAETTAVTYTEKVITGKAPPITHLQKVIAGEANPVTHLEHVWAGGSPTPTEHEYTGAVPYTFTADGSPLIDYTIYGNMVQSGTPTPDAPITPSECGERTKNWLDKSTSPVTIYPSTPTISNSSNAISVIIPVEPNTTYTFSKKAGNRNRFCETETVPTQGSAANNYINADNEQSQTISTGSTTHYILWWVGYQQTYSEIAETMQVETGSEATSYEPYGYKIPVISAGQTNNIYLGNVQTTRYIKKLVLDGTENWEIRQEGTKQEFFMFQTGSSAVNHLCICTHYSQATISTTSTTNTAVGVDVTAQGHIRFRTQNVSAMSLNDFKAWLTSEHTNGTPVIFWYVLIEPETGIVNEPIRKIGDYADTVSMEQAGASIPTTNGSTTIDVLTELKPSEIYIKYKGVKKP